MSVAAQVRNPTIDESILEPNVGMASKGVLIARVIVTPKKVPIRIINSGLRQLSRTKE